MLLMLVTGTTQGVAQNVTISPNSGSTVSAVMSGIDTGYALGLSSLWTHEQLSLTMTASDRDGLTDGGGVTTPGSVLGTSADGKRLTIIGGHRPSYLVVSLPKGYRITGYRLTLINDLVGENVIPDDLPEGATQPNDGYSTLNSGAEILSGGTAIMRFFETKPWETDHTNSGCTGRSDGMGYNANQVRYIELGSNWQNGQQIGTTADEVLAQAMNGDDGDITPDDDGEEFYMERFGDDMGNQLYFRLVKNYSYYGISIKSFEILFTAEGTFDALVTPDAVGSAQHVVKSPFLTSKIDIGPMDMNTDPNTGARRYTYKENNVKDIVAYTYLYQQGAVKDGKPSEDVTIPARISPVKVDDNNLYALGNDTYFIETPVEVETQSNVPAPIGYRIVGATFNYLWGSEAPGYNPGPYTLNVYDKTGKTVVESIDVTAENAGGEPIVLKNLNNDAVKFSIEGLCEGDDPTTEAVEVATQALVSVTLQMQALDPYINKMDIVCTDNNEVLELKQTFTANDFSVSGGKFIFYVPEDYAGQELTFTFKDLYSKYGDNTYYDGTGTGYSRYSYVNSKYFEKVDGDEDDGLYDTDKYDPDEPYGDKVLTSVAGNIRFKFNNAEDLGEPGEQNFLVEYPFSVSKYLTTTDPDNSSSSAEAAAFIPCKLKAVADVDQNSDIFYVFTADETRWNIAPTKAWQHRAYAFYRMDIELRAKTFTPAITPTRIYEKTFYSKDGSNTEDSMWGVSLKTTDPEDNDKEVVGYLSVQEILDHIKGRAASGEDSDDAIDGILDETGNNGPKSMKEILYIDGTNLKSILNSSKTEPGSETPTVLDLNTLRNEMAANALIFLPENTTSTIDNVAYKTSGVTYHAGKNIVITDKNPFYSPYDIQVDPANYAMYTRKVTNSSYDAVQYATVFMPFTITLDAGGLHTSKIGDVDYGTLKFLQMNGSNATSNKKFDYLGEVDVDAAFFTKSSDDKVKANTPYALQIVDKGSSNDSFTLVQYGSNIVATPKTDILFSAEDITSTGDLTDKYGETKPYSFTHVGTFSGGKVAKGKRLFYFANNGFYSSVELKDKYTTVDIYPFRSVYQTSGTGSAKVGYLMLVEGENPNTATGITDVDKVFTGITTGKGFISITTDADTAYRIRTVSGQNIDALNLKAGESRTVYVPAGIYLVNGLKVLVK